MEFLPVPAFDDRDEIGFGTPTHRWRTVTTNCDNGNFTAIAVLKGVRYMLLCILETVEVVLEALED